MAILVLAVGGVMVVAGMAEMFYGSGMIEIERGWSAFIGGTVLLAGGVLTMALGLAVRALGEVKGVLVRLGGMDGRLAPAAHPEIAVTPREPVALREVEPTMQLEHPGFPLEPHLDSAPGMPGIAHAAELPPLRLREEPVAPSLPAFAETSHAAAPLMDDWLDGDGREPAAAAARDDGLTERADDPLHDPEYAHAEHAEINYAEPAVPAAVEARPTPRQADSRQADPRQAEAPPAAAPAAAALPAPPQPAVIGRYEADGTSYVMYADGSIEAQSEAGIYRFASMAELKSFIET